LTPEIFAHLSKAGHSLLSTFDWDEDDRVKGSIQSALLLFTDLHLKQMMAEPVQKVSNEAQFLYNEHMVPDCHKTTPGIIERKLTSCNESGEEDNRKNGSEHLFLLRESLSRNPDVNQETLGLRLIFFLEMETIV
jgi:hypothetical protein